jgi:hypothetical protein
LQKERQIKRKYEKKKHDLIDKRKGSNTTKPICWYLELRLPTWYENNKINKNIENKAKHKTFPFNF